MRVSGWHGGKVYSPEQLCTFCRFSDRNRSDKHLQDGIAVARSPPAARGSVTPTFPLLLPTALLTCILPPSSSSPSVAKSSLPFVVCGADGLFSGKSAAKTQRFSSRSVPCAGRLCLPLTLLCGHLKGDLPSCFQSPSIYSSLLKYLGDKHTGVLSETRLVLALAPFWELFSTGSSASALLQQGRCKSAERPDQLLSDGSASCRETYSSESRWILYPSPHTLCDPALVST